MKLKRNNLLINIVVSFFSTSFIYKSVFFGKHYGDASDGTVQMVLHEHWWHWISGKTSFTKTEFFYPYDKAFGYSDVFIIQGPTHAALRALGIEVFQAWTLTTFIFLVLGNIGWAVLGNLIIKNNSVQLFFTASMTLSSSFVGYFQSAPNIVGYTWLSWFAILTLKLINNYKNNSRKFNYLFILYFNLLIVYALSCWYGAFFLISIVFVSLAIFLSALAYKRDLSNFLKDLRHVLNLRIILMGTPSFIILLFLFIYIYVMVQGEPFRPVSEMLSKSPRLFYLFNGAHVNTGGILKPIYDLLGFDKQVDMQLGIGLVTFISSVTIFAIGLFKFLKENKTRGQLLLASFFASTILLFIYFAAWTDDFSIHSIFFNKIMGLHSIRVPVRFVIVLGYVAILGIAIFVDRNLSTKKQISRILYFILAVILLDQYRSPSPGWDKSVVINQGLESQTTEIVSNCDYFYFDAPGGWWYDQVVAMAFSYKVNVPTTNGNSGAYPPNYPVMSFTHEGDISGMINWINKIDKALTGCITNGSIPVFVLGQGESRFELESGFTPTETDGKNNWRWAVNDKAYAFVYSVTGKDVIIEFEISNSECSENRNLKILKNQQQLIRDLNLTKRAEKFKINIPMEAQLLQKLSFITSEDFCSIQGDPRTLYYEVKNWKIS